MAAYLARIDLSSKFGREEHGLSKYENFSDWIARPSKAKPYCIKYHVIARPSTASSSGAYHLFASRLSSLNGFTYLGEFNIVDCINSTDLGNCMEEIIKCAMTCLINTVFCYLFEAKDVVLTGLLMQKSPEPEYILSENLKNNKHSLLMQGELLKCQYNQYLLSSQLGLPFKLTLSASSPQRWKTEYKGISSEFIKGKRLFIYQGMMQEAKSSVRNKSFIREYNLIMRFSERSFREFYNMSVAQALASKPPPPITASAMSSDTIPLPPIYDQQPLGKRSRVDPLEDGVDPLEYGADPLGYGGLEPSGEAWLASPECEKMLDSWMTRPDAWSS